MEGKRIRVLIAKPGLDGHDRGAKVVARGLRDAGMEVIYTGLRQTPEEIIRAAMQEDVDIIGLSILSGAHMSVCKKVLELMEKYDFHVPVFVGGIIPADDAEELLKMGIKAVFGPGTPISEVVEKINEVVKQGVEQA
ncbi:MULTISPECIES: cobalamin B12-binding domain-containing protein [Fervidobacterium]|uniref:Cobalamin B12-binding domain protein n=1 Tax=Fervidobacterium nodosum (strain ATCC 35602 / DSM 5306 / Rt17-B1) TaxID=381764 RepID=A7HMN6_FERNB|nr:MULTISPECIES: cobalamin B12-binding domain-containing protein [Fervidobacterium]ABS61169.1 cobalamin B12-binding domain protein [Fervidobacterium nodosum Rt17-B1]KAF2961127.1 methylmalonyl-CoA mutase [Fervidobacterium sp. 2310opik-2]PHJ14094.1 methylmalonyl-CoA mutase [Fervidobacterium sp. SC_NGM5_G05]